MVRFGTVGAVWTKPWLITKKIFNHGFNRTVSDPVFGPSGHRWPAGHSWPIKFRVVFTIWNNDIVTQRHPVSPKWHKIATPIPSYVTCVDVATSWRHHRTCQIRFCDNIGSTRDALGCTLEVLLSDLDALEWYKCTFVPTLTRLIPCQVTWHCHMSSRDLWHHQLTNSQSAGGISHLGFDSLWVISMNHLS